jgi:photosystem II stability/assembly factor-like uncharacterized protein
MKLILKFTILTLCCVMILPSCGKKEGCTDPTSLNYDADADKDDGSCIYPNWNATGVIGGGQIFCITPSGSNIFVGTETGVFITTNGGEKWTAVNNGLDGPIYVFSIAVNGTTIVAGTEYGIYKSTNNGSNWTGVYFDDVVYSVAISGTSILAGTESSGILRSVDNGATWNPINNGYDPYQATWTIAVEGNNIYAGRPYAWPNFYVSRDNGNSWDPSYIAGDVFSIAILGSNVFAGTESGGVFLSTDHGANWSEIGNGLPGNDVYALVANGSNVYAGNNANGVYATANNGSLWSPFNEGLTDAIIGSFGVSGGFIYASAESSVYRRAL